MAKGGLKPPKPRPTKEATLTDISDLLKPEVFERLGPIGTMNMIQTMATAAKIPEVTNLPALVDEPLLPALAGEPAAQKRVQRKVSEAKTGLESPKRRQILKAAKDVAGATLVPIPTSAKDVLINEVVKPAAKAAIPDASIQAAIASFLKPKLKPVQLERIGRKNFERTMETGEDEFDPISPADISRHSGIPIEDVNDFLGRNKLDPGLVLSDVARDLYNYKGYEDEIFDTLDLDDVVNRGGPNPFEQAIEEYLKQNPKADLSNYSDDDIQGIAALANDYIFENTHGPQLKELSMLVGDKEAKTVRDAVRRRYDDYAGSLYEGFGERVVDYIEEYIR